MKYHRLCLLLLLVVGLGGCDFLSYDESSRILSEEETFTTRFRIKAFLTGIYDRVPNGFNAMGDAMRAAATDDAEEIDDVARVQIFNDGRWSPTQHLDSEWGPLYEGIRAANVFLEKFDIDKLDHLRYNKDYERIIAQVRVYPYEARFLRAYFYFELSKRYGGVPLITSVLTPQEANAVKPASYEEVIQFIVSECDAIIPHLPVDYHSLPQKETGRATRGAAMALKARALLYAASPLHNPSGDVEKWVKAAKAAKAIIDSSWYSLESEYSDVVNNRKSEELIWGRRQGPSNSFERDNFPVGFVGQTRGGTAPTQNLVSAYEMQATGLPIHAPDSGYDPAHPYEGRDPRLKKTILVNNSPWKGRKVEIWKGGRSGPPQDDATETGYYLKKYLVESTDISAPERTTRVHTWVIFRYGEVLLNYAEAMNEAYGPENAAGLGMTARQAVNLVRARAGMPPFPPGLTKAQFREKLRNERRVELAFEGHRFWDIRRWKIGPSTTDIYGTKVTKTSDSTFTYEKVLVETRVWNDRMYLYPIPQSELAINPALKQNPGW